MRNVLRLAAGDFKRLFSNIVSIIIVLGLVLLPSIFTWYNVLACWDVFGNTGNLKVAVANSDEGYQSDLVPLKVNIGDQVVSALRANDQMNWVFTDEEDAVDGAELVGLRRDRGAPFLPGKADAPVLWNALREPGERPRGPRPVRDELDVNPSVRPAPGDRYGRVRPVGGDIDAELERRVFGYLAFRVRPSVPCALGERLLADGLDPLA